ncbi:tyrosine-type recombinase/integrase [Microbispora sp. CA-135349]|uniref:tyrosine-type recombinase/integrase n=1 Tax=Microbispora sp. CA-135349 TaxID=3239953 RepID=UPI003D94691A
MRRVRLHDLRHTCATILLAQGVDTRIITEILGHSTIVLTMNTYAHVLPEHQATALDKLEKALGRGATGFVRSAPAFRPGVKRTVPRSGAGKADSPSGGSASWRIRRDGCGARCTGAGR